MQSQLDNTDKFQKAINGKLKKSSSGDESDYEDKGSPQLEQERDVESPRSPTSNIRKKRKISTTNGKGGTSQQLIESIFATPIENYVQTSEPPLRKHRLAYHRPLLLDKETGSKYRLDLLKWFDSVSTVRSMPWRKAWIDPNSFEESSQSTLRSALERRAYEVWISEIMLQQTRVAVVIDYWNRWMERWPRIQDLASASADDVLSAWRGLGYYSRATRIHEAAKKVVNDKKMQGLLPRTAEELQAHVPGVGRYTGGAISAIVFGHAEPMVDGNVLRVLSRQIGLFTNVKTNKIAIDTLWAVADALVKAVAQDHAIKAETDTHSQEHSDVSDGPGRWGQALMELGSTICTPKPDCANCPITATCRSYAEGVSLARKANLMPASSQRANAIEDIEDLCAVCEPYEDVANAIDSEIDAKEETPSSSNGAPPTAKAKARQTSLSAFAFTSKSKISKEIQASQSSDLKPSAKAMEIIVDHCKKFPVKVIKKAVREEETIVCVIRYSDGRIMIDKRPDKGLLASMWEFPSLILPNTNDSTSKERKQRAIGFVEKVIDNNTLVKTFDVYKELGSVSWLFSHLKLTMHVYLCDVHQHSAGYESSSRRRLASHDEIEAESMGTGMRKCWSLVKERL